MATTAYWTSLVSLGRALAQGFKGNPTHGQHMYRNVAKGTPLYRRGRGGRTAIYSYMFLAEDHKLRPIFYILCKFMR